MFSLSDKVAVVTGGASGIGEAIVKMFLSAGATVYSADLSDKCVEGAISLTADVSNEEQLEAVLAEAAASGNAVPTEAATNTRGCRSD